MKTKVEATIEDLYRVPGNAKAELVNGEIVLMPPTGDSPSRAGFHIGRSLFDYEQLTGLGRTFPDGTGFIVNLPHRRSFSPDVAFHMSRPPAGVVMRFVDGAPIFAVEVRSENDYGPAAEKAMAAKRADYFATGAEVVWDVDLRSKDVVRVYRQGNPDQPTIYGRGEMAEAEPALPGWTMPVDDLFL